MVSVGASLSHAAWWELEAQGRQRGAGSLSIYGTKGHWEHNSGLQILTGHRCMEISKLPWWKAIMAFMGSELLKVWSGFQITGLFLPPPDSVMSGNNVKRGRLGRQKWRTIWNWYLEVCVWAKGKVSTELCSGLQYMCILACNLV